MHILKLFDDIYYYRHPQGANCNVYVFRDGPEYDLIDTGISRLRIVDWLWREMRRDGIEPTAVRNIYHAHVHFDHVQSDVFFQTRARRHRGNVKVYCSREDRFRFSPRYRLMGSNVAFLEERFPGMARDFGGMLWLANVFFEPLLHCETPSNIHTYADGDTMMIGRRKARVYVTGGHTEGHAFFYFPEGNILYTGDHDALNEFSCDWGKVLAAAALAERLDPDTVFIGHNAVKQGDNAKRWVRHYFDQFRQYAVPLARVFRGGQTVDVFQLVSKMAGWAGKMGPVALFAVMSVSCILRHLESVGFGRCYYNAAKRSLVFEVAHSASADDLLELLHIPEE
jgi:glyoxylase-like metal-dependent hydrolase (beta-lactamase superfamily II)